MHCVAAGKTGGVYIPPFKLARMMQDVRDRSSPEYQRLTWEVGRLVLPAVTSAAAAHPCLHACQQALKKSINGIINKINATNIKNMLAEVFREVRL